MSAPIEVVAPVRVKLLFNNLPLESSWVLVKTKKYSKVKEFLAYIKRKFIPKADGSLSVQINGCKVPEWEKSCIFREDDVVQLYFHEGVSISDRSVNPKFCEYDTGERIVHKKKRKKNKEESIPKLSLEKEYEEMNTCRSPEDDNIEKKKRKLSTEKQEALPDENAGAEKKAEGEQESVTRKRKRTRKRKNRKEEAATPLSISHKPVNVRPLRQYADTSNNLHIKFSSDNEEEERNSASDTKQLQQDFIHRQTHRTSTPVCQTNQNQSAGAGDFSYSGQNSFSVEKPNLTQSVLANGVTVFSRPRSRQIKSNNFRELSKDEQLSTQLTNRSFVLQNTNQSNGLESQSFTSMDIPESNLSGTSNIAIPVRRDYQKFPLLKGNPSPGDMIAFKILEMSDDYTPEVGDYKEAEIIGFNSSSQIVELKIIPGFIKERKLGKFDVDFGEDVDEVQGSAEEIQTHPLTSLMEVRLITD